MSNALGKFIEQGLASDFFEAERHYFIFRTLGSNSDSINNSADDFRKKAAVYLQNSSMDLCILDLTRIFDKKGKYPSRCLEEVLLRCRNQKTAYFPLDLEYYPSISYLCDVAEVGVEQRHMSNQDSFTDLLFRVLKSTTVTNAIKSIKKIRDKHIAHNENLIGPIDLPTFWDDYFLLLSIAKSYLTIIGSVFVSAHYVLSEDPRSAKVEMSTYFQSAWVIELIESIIGGNEVKIPLSFQ